MLRIKQPLIILFLYLRLIYLWQIEARNKCFVIKFFRCERWINHSKISMHNGRQTSQGNGVSLDRWSSSDGGTAGDSHMKFSRLTKTEFYYQHKVVKLLLILVTNHPVQQEQPVWMAWDMFILKKKRKKKRHLFPWFIASFICKSLWIKAKSWMPHNPAVYSTISVKLLSSVRKWHCRWSQLIRKQKSTFCSCVFLLMTHICTYVQAHTHTEVTDAVNHLWMMALKIIKQ